MVKLIRKIFIKDYENVTDKTVREKHGTVSSIFGMVTNLILFAIKFLIGLISASMSIISDAINNLTDLFSNFVSLLGFKIANKPADKKHPFGHERVEYITGMIISFIIISVGVVLGYTAINKLIAVDKTTNFQIASFIVLGVAIIGKLLLGLFYKGMGNAIDSVSLKASKQDSFNDAISTFIVLITAIVQFFVPTLWWLDAAMSILVAVFIIYSGVKLILETAAPLIGVSADHGFAKSIAKDVLSYPGILGIHDLVCHFYGPTKKFITLHAEVDGYGNIMEIHDIIDNIEEDLRKKYECEITIHMDPLDTKNKEIPVLKEVIRKTLDSFDVNLTFHDLRLVAGPTHTNVLFDVVMPLEANYTSIEVVKQLQKEIKKLDIKYLTVVHIDSMYVH